MIQWYHWYKFWNDGLILYSTAYAMCKVESIARAVCLLCALAHLWCAMHYVLYAVRGESIVQGLHSRLISPLSLTVSSPPVIYWMLSSKWTLSKNEIFQWWLLPFFSFEVDAINLNQLFVLDCSYHNLERGKQQILEGDILVNFCVNKH